MGEFSTLYINDYEVDSWKNSIGYSYILFSENDFVETTQFNEGDEEPRHVYQYVITAANLIDRLEVLGFTIKKVKKDFEEGKALILEKSRQTEQQKYSDDTGNSWKTPPYAPY